MRQSTGTVSLNNYHLPFGERVRVRGLDSNESPSSFRQRRIRLWRISSPHRGEEKLKKIFPFTDALQEKIKTLPSCPGVYIMKDPSGKIIYIGKAASLKKRIASYFAKTPVSYKAGILIANIADIDYISTASEEEALLLEAALIKEEQPKFNIMLKDDKRYPLLKLTLNEKFPRLIIARRIKKDRAMYFGPYTSATLLRRALAVMRKIFPLRTCRTMPKTACLNYHIGQCAAPCIKKISGVEYGQIVEDVILFLKAKRNELLENLSKRMADLAGKKMFEEAGRIRDQIQALTAVRFNKPYSIKKRRAVASGIVELKSVLGLDKLPIRIEAFDISDISGKEAVGSMVSFLNGKPDKSNYRRFRIKTVFAVDDYKMMQEVIRRRYKRLLRENAQLPDMIIIDGGKGHVSAAKAVLDELHLNKVKLFGIAKKLDKIFSSKGEERITDGLRQVIQHIRDEAHRFAQNYHHVLRRKKIIGK